MASNVVHLHPAPDLHASAADAIASAANADLRQVVVIGWTAKGDLYADGNIDDGPTLLWMLEAIKHQLMQAGT